MTSFPSYLRPICIPMGIRVRVRNPNPTQFPWDLLPWQPIVYSRSDWSSGPTGMQPIVSCFRGAACSTFQSATQTFQELKLFLELQLSENSCSTLKRRASCTTTLDVIEKYGKSHSYLHKTAFIPIHPSRRTSSKKIRKTWRVQV